MPKIRVGHITVAVFGAYVMNAVLIAGTDWLLSSMLGNANSQLYLVIDLISQCLYTVGATILMTVSLVEITFYVSALHADPPTMPYISLVLISAVQHLYFIVAAPSLFLPLGIVLLRSAVLPPSFGYVALSLAGAFAALGAAYMLRLTLPAFVTGFAGVQALWWLAASIALIVRSGTVTA